MPEFAHRVRGAAPGKSRPRHAEQYRARRFTELSETRVATRSRGPVASAMACRANPPSATGGIGRAVAARASAGDDRVTMPEGVRAPKSHRLLRSTLPQFLHEKPAKMARGTTASPATPTGARPLACGARYSTRSNGVMWRHNRIAGTGESGYNTSSRSRGVRVVPGTGRPAIPSMIGCSIMQRARARERRTRWVHWVQLKLA